MWKGNTTAILTEKASTYCDTFSHCITPQEMLCWEIPDTIFSFNIRRMCSDILLLNIIIIHCLTRITTYPSSLHTPVRETGKKHKIQSRLRACASFLWLINHTHMCMHTQPSGWPGKILHFWSIRMKLLHLKQSYSELNPKMCDAGYVFSTGLEEILPHFFSPFPSSSSIPIHCGDPGTHWLGQEPKYKSFGTKSWFKFEVWRKMWNYTSINRSVKTFLLSKTWKSEKDETGKCVKQHSSDTQASGRSNLTAHICDNSQE